METNAARDALFKSNAIKLSKIMSWVDLEDGAWQLEDRPALLRHQLSAPLEFDLMELATAQAGAEMKENTLRPAADLRIRTFKDLLHHPTPPLALLKFAKDLFKRMAADPSQPKAQREIAHLLYVVVVLVAVARQRAPISKLTDPELRRGIQWAMARDWIDPETKALLAACEKDATA